MLISRGRQLFKNILTRPTIKRTGNNVVPSRLHGQYFYRDVPTGDKYEIIATEIFGGIMWWWIMWNLWHNWGHIVGEYDYPDPSKWTDEELGIPPDD